jgi:magnesium-transporting ATPase (P-type)
MYAETKAINAAYASVEEYDEGHGTRGRGTTQITRPLTEPTALLVLPSHVFPGDGAPPEQPIHQKRLLFAWIIIASVLYGAIVLFCLIMMSLMGQMLFDSGVGMKTLTTFAFAEGIFFSLAGLSVYAVAFMWRNYNSREYKKVLRLSLIPILMYALIVLLYG